MHAPNSDWPLWAKLHHGRGCAKLAAGSGYDKSGVGATKFLNRLGVSESERVLVHRSNIAVGDVSRFPIVASSSSPGRNHVLMASTEPEANEYREWLAGGVVVVVDAFGAGGPSILDTDLAANLGMADPHKMRPLIRANLGELAGLGTVSAQRAETSGPVVAAPAPPSTSTKSRPSSYASCPAPSALRPSARKSSGFSRRIGGGIWSPPQFAFGSVILLQSAAG